MITKEEAIKLLEEISDVKEQSKKLGSQALKAKKAGNTQLEKTLRSEQATIKKRWKEIENVFIDEFEFEKVFRNSRIRFPERIVEEIVENDGVLKGSMFNERIVYFQD